MTVKVCFHAAAPQHETTSSTAALGRTFCKGLHSSKPHFRVARYEKLSFLTYFANGLLFSVSLLCSTAIADQNLFDDICLEPNNVEFCDLHYILEYCDWEPDQEKTSETLDCFVEAGNALNDEIVECVRQSAQFEDNRTIRYNGASGLAAWYIEYRVPTQNGALFFNTGALWGGQEFDSTFVELFSFSTGRLFIDGMEVAAPRGRTPIGDALDEEFWRLFVVGRQLTTSDHEKFEIAHVRDFFTTHWAAMETCLVEAPDIFNAD